MERERPDFPAVERDVLSRWVLAKVASRSTTRTPRGAVWTCWQHPQPAIGMPGIQQLPELAITDLYRRLKTMQGFHVPRYHAWNCHGLAVEVAAERELGLRVSADIEAYGPGRFAARCQESTVRHAAAMSAVAERLGCMRADDAACRTCDAHVIESVWRSLSRAFEAGLLVRDHRVGPYCPRCRTPLDVNDLSRQGAGGRRTGTAVIVRLRLTALPEGANPRLRGADLMIESTAPWTLAANAAVAVHPHLTYALVRGSQDDEVVIAESRIADVLGEGWRVAARLAGTELSGASYLPPLDAREPAQPRPVIASYRVGADSGTGVAHLAPAYNADDMTACLAHGIDVPDPVGEDGRFGAAVPVIRGVFFADADPLVISALADRGALFSSRPRETDDPHCKWCGTRVLCRARRAWHLRTELAGSRIDWTLSRSRYWGTPLPLWECPRGHVSSAGSLSELSALAGRDVRSLDPHRPSIDAVLITCPSCGATSRRVPDVIDDEYDAGWLSFMAADGAAAERAAADGGELAARAHLITTSADDGDRWLSAVRTVGALSGRQLALGTVLRLGSVLDGAGRPMSRSLGNLVAALPLVQRCGADSARWRIAAAPAGASHTMSEAALEDISATVLRQYWNAADLLLRSAVGGKGEGRPCQLDDDAIPERDVRPLADRWMLGELQSMVRDVTDALDGFNSAAAAARIATFASTLAGRYLGRCRNRLTRSHGTASRLAAFATLYECVEVLTRVMAPITPFLTDHVWSLISCWRPDAPDSVHLADWPSPELALIDHRLEGQIALGDRLAALGRSARAAAGIDVHRRLGRAIVCADGMTALREDLRAHLAHELHVGAVDAVAMAAGETIEADGWTVAAEGADLVALETAVHPA